MKCIESDCNHYQNFKLDQYPSTVAAHDRLEWIDVFFIYSKKHSPKKKLKAFACVISYQRKGPFGNCCSLGFFSYHRRHFEFANIFLLHLFYNHLIRGEL